MEQVPKGDALGGLIVDGASWGRASVKAEYEESIEHPSFEDYSKTADRTPTGHFSGCRQGSGLWK